MKIRKLDLNEYQQPSPKSFISSVTNVTCLLNENFQQPESYKLVTTAEVHV